MGSEPYSPSPEELLVERSFDAWVNACDRWASIVMDIAGRSEPQRELVDELKQLSTDVAFRATGWRIIATPLREFADALAGYAIGLEPWDDETLRRYLRGADIIVSEVRDRACAGALERGDSSRPAASSGPATDQFPPDSSIEVPTCAPSANGDRTEMHCGGDVRYPVAEWICFQDAVEELSIPETTLQRWVKSLPAGDRAETEPIKRIVIRRSVLQALRARRDAKQR